MNTGDDMNHSVDLLSFCEHGGCSAKLAAEQLDQLLGHLVAPSGGRLLVGADTHDDAAVYEIDSERALIVTTDFFPPICSDPYEFGRIAAANALSDVYAMGGKPELALNIVLFPQAKLPLDALRAMLEGGADTIREAGALTAGGHTVDNPVPVYGLSVHGSVHPQRIMTNSAARPGQVVLLTKPLGTGVLTAAARVGEASADELQQALDSMKTLNNTASSILAEFEVRACTDITGFGLAGHALKMARASNVCIRLYAREVPLLPRVSELLDAGCIPGAAFRNQHFVEPQP
jgi:selenide,water dikinase